MYLLNHIDLINLGYFFKGFQCKMDDCFDKILKIYDNNETMKYKLLIEIMKDLDKEISNTLRIRNCLIFLINLCFNPKYPDYLDSKGKRPRELSEEEKLNMYDILKCEFNNQNHF